MSTLIKKRDLNYKGNCAIKLFCIEIIESMRKAEKEKTVPTIPPALSK